MVQPYRDDQTERRFFVGTNYHVLCIDQQSGEVVWKTALRDAVGTSLVSLLLHQDRIFAACRRYVACIEVADGKMLWGAELKKLAEPASLALDLRVPGGQLLVAAGGWIYSLEAEHGAVQWDNGLPGLGYEPICLRVPGAVVAQPLTRYVTRGKSKVAQPLENDQPL